jgi:hypothetical protein
VLGAAEFCFLFACFLLLFSHMIFGLEKIQVCNVMWLWGHEIDGMELCAGMDWSSSMSSTSGSWIDKEAKRRAEIEKNSGRKDFVTGGFQGFGSENMGGGTGGGMNQARSGGFGEIGKSGALRRCVSMCAPPCSHFIRRVLCQRGQNCCLCEMSSFCLIFFVAQKTALVDVEDETPGAGLTSCSVSAGDCPIFPYKRTRWIWKNGLIQTVRRTRRVRARRRRNHPRYAFSVLLCLG